MPFVFGQKSKSKLEKLDCRMVVLCERALAQSNQDFTVFETLRTPKRQAYLYKIGRSKTLNSRHFANAYGKSVAVDVVAYIGGGRLSWDEEAMHKVCKAMANAAYDLGIADRVKWGGTWQRLSEIDPDDLKGAIKAYVAKRRAMNRSAFVDMAHFELVE